MTSVQSSVAAPPRQPAQELQPLAKNWWMVAGRGVLAVVFGTAIALWRMPVFEAVVISFGAYAIADGLLAMTSALRAARPLTAGWPIALEGAVSVALGAVALSWPLVPRQMIIVLAVWGLLTGILELMAAVRLPRDRAAHWLVGTGGASSIFLALVVLALPHLGSAGVALSLAAYAVVFGIAILLAAVGFKLGLPVSRLDSAARRRPIRKDGEVATGKT